MNDGGRLARLRQRASHLAGSKTFEIVALLGLILLAAAVRFYRLHAQDIWGDEAFSIYLSQQPLSTVVAGASDTHPPFYPLLLFFWLRLVGPGAYATRALSALAGILVVPLIYVLAARLAPQQPRVRWFAAILAAFSPLLVYYSQETRMYEMVTVLSLASVVCLTPFPLPPSPSPDEGAASPPSPNPLPPLLTEVRQERGKGARGLGVRYLLFTALAMYTHYSAFFVLAAENIFVLIRLRKNWSALVRWGVLQLILAVAYVPWIIVQTSFLSGKASGRFSEWGWNGVEMIFGKSFLSFSAGLTVDFPIVQMATAAFLAVAAVGIYATLRAKERSGLWGIAPLYFLVPIGVAYVVNPVMPFFFERYVLVAVPGFILTVALGLDWLAQRARYVTLGAVGLFVVVSAFSLGNLYFNDAYAKGKYGQMMAYVSSHAQPGDALILNNPLQKPLYLYYAPHNIPAFYFPDAYPLEDPRTRQQLDDAASKYTRLWVVMFGNPAEYDPTGYLERWMGAHAFKSYFGGYVDSSLSLYVMPSATTVANHPLHATLGENIQLLGYTLDRAQVQPGQTVQLTLRWQANAPIARRYTVFTHLIGAINPATQSPVWAQMDSEPVGGSRPTTGWPTGETIEDHYGLQIPPNTPPGNYELEIGMYDPTTLARLPVQDEQGHRMADDRILLDTVSISTP